MRNLLVLGILLLMPILSSCSDDKDDEPNVESSKIEGVWECTSCEVVDMAGLNGLDLPDVVVNLITNQLVGDMVGSTITITDKAKVSGDMLIFPDSNIRWKIISLTDRNMTVQYDTSSASGGYGMNMTVKAAYKKIK